MNRKLVFLDIDGTLASSFNYVPVSARTVCRAARKNGHLVYIVSGRSRAQISESVLSVGFDGIVCSGGAYIEIDGRTLFSEFLPRDILERLVAYFSERSGGFSLELPEKIITNPQFYSIMPRALSSALLRLLRCYAPFGVAFDKERVCKVVFVESKDVHFEDVQNEFGADCEMFKLSTPVPGISGGEISPKGIHKGAAVEWVARYHGIERENIIAFGDSDNDRTMLEYAGLGIAMGNSDKALKRVADDVTGHVRRSGLAKAFRKYGLI
jgi:Cof subfamily protein (haloacid dehalogenase superfamily)